MSIEYLSHMSSRPCMPLSLPQVHELTRVKMCDVFLGQEYCAGGTLKNLIVRYQANKEGRLYTWETAFRLLR